MTLTAVALLPHSMENSIVLMDLRAVYSDCLQLTSNNNYQSNYSLFEARGSILLGQVTMEEVRGPVCVCAVGTMSGLYSCGACLQ